MPKVTDEMKAEHDRISDTIFGTKGGVAMWVYRGEPNAAISIRMGGVACHATEMAEVLAALQIAIAATAERIAQQTGIGMAEFSLLILNAVDEYQKRNVGVEYVSGKGPYPKPMERN